jgi:hypothetical protein
MLEGANYLKYTIQTGSTIISESRGRLYDGFSAVLP